MKLKLQLIDETGKLWDSHDLPTPPRAEGLSGQEFGPADLLSVSWGQKGLSMLIGNCCTLLMPTESEVSDGEESFCPVCMMSDGHDAECPNATKAAAISP